MANLSPEGTACFVNTLFEAERYNNNPDNPLYYSVNMVFTPDDQKSPQFKAMEQAVARAIKEKWPKTPKGLKLPIRDVSESASLEDHFPEGSVFVNFRTKTKPHVVDQKRQPLSQGDLYSGVRARVSWTCSAFDKGGGRGATLFLGNFQLVGQGTALGPGKATDPNDDFEELPMDEEDLDELF